LLGNGLLRAPGEGRQRRRRRQDRRGAGAPREQVTPGQGRTAFGRKFGNGHESDLRVSARRRKGGVTVPQPGRRHNRPPPESAPHLERPEALSPGTAATAAAGGSRTQPTAARPIVTALPTSPRLLPHHAPGR